MSLLTVLIIVVLLLVLWQFAPSPSPYAFPSWGRFLLALLVVLLLLDVLGVVKLR